MVQLPEQEAAANVKSQGHQKGVDRNKEKEAEVNHDHEAAAV